MGKLKLECCKCGNVMETLPQGAQDIMIDEETGEVLYYNGPKFGYLPANCVICEKCQEKMDK